MFAVCTNAADNRRDMDNHSGLNITQQAANITFMPQIIILAAHHENIFCSAFAQFGNHVGTEEARSAGYDDGLIGPIRFIQHDIPISLVAPGGIDAVELSKLYLSSPDANWNLIQPHGS